MFLVGCLGLGGNLFSLTLLLKRKAQKTFHNLLLLHCSFDMVGLGGLSFQLVCVDCIPSFIVQYFRYLQTFLNIAYEIPISYL